MKRLYQKIYLTIIVALLVVVLVAGTVWKVLGGERRDAGADMLGVLVSAALPPASAPTDVQRRGLIELAAKLKLTMALYDHARVLIGTTDELLPLPGAFGHPRRWHRGVLTIQLPDRRFVVTKLNWRGRPPAIGLLAFLAAIALAVGLCAYPVVRGLTRRLERLQQGVETLGSGNVKARIKVEGRDEVARLAISFNEAAARIETLLGAHQQLLANASHELRTPLARLTMGIELAGDNINAARRAELRRDLGELNDLIEEILTASRLNAVPELAATDAVDLLALAAEECAGYKCCSLSGDIVSVKGDARLLRRALRNLIENARRYGKPPIEIMVGREGSTAVIDVIDNGPGIPADKREAIFTPFYRLQDAGADPARRDNDSRDNNQHSDIEAANAGAGIGLALVRQIARSHGGDAFVVVSSTAERAVQGDHTGFSTDGRNRLRITLPIVQF